MDSSRFKWPGEGCCVSSAADGSSTICDAWSEDDGRRKAQAMNTNFIKFQCLSIPSCWSLLTKLAGAMTVPGRLWRSIDAIWHDHSPVFHRPKKAALQRLQRLTATVPSLELLPPVSGQDGIKCETKFKLKWIEFYWIDILEYQILNL